LKDPYNLGSKIHPKKNDKILAYIDPNLALLGSFNFDKEELSKNYNGKEIKIKELKAQALDKLKTRRFLYLVDKNSFIPHEKGANQKFFSQNPVTILQKEKINSVYDYILPSTVNN
jgi:cellulose biosynthesis protein BcsQ